MLVPSKTLLAMFFLLAWICRAYSLEPFDQFQDCETCPIMIVLPAGSFMMGSPDDEIDREQDEGPVHIVNILKPFAVGKFEITVAQYSEFISSVGRSELDACSYWSERGPIRDDLHSWQNPDFEQTESDAVLCVNWHDAQRYIQWLNKKTERTYRLLTEAEWEYAARAGHLGRNYWDGIPDTQCAHGNGSDKSLNHFLSLPTAADCNDKYPYSAPVGSFQANDFGLYDMLGNANEWLEDCWADSYHLAPSDGSAWLQDGCDRGILRGGAWFNSPRVLRFANRLGNDRDLRLNTFGFRLAMSIDE